MEEEKRLESIKINFESQVEAGKFERFLSELGVRFITTDYGPSVGPDFSLVANIEFVIDV